MEEIWKDIKGYEGLYQISNFGRVRSLDRFEKSKGDSTRLRKGKDIKFRIRKDGYCRVNLCKDSKMKTFMIHRLVAQAFIENPQGLPIVNHIDGNKQNNHVSNLEWCTVSENTYHATHTLHTNTGYIKGAEVTRVKTFILDTNTGEVREFNSRKECEDFYGAEFRAIVGSRQCKRFKHLRLVGDANATNKLENQ